MATGNASYGSLRPGLPCSLSYDGLEHYEGACATEYDVVYDTERSLGNKRDHALPRLVFVLSACSFEEQNGKSATWTFPVPAAEAFWRSWRFWAGMTKRLKVSYNQVSSPGESTSFALGKRYDIAPGRERVKALGRLTTRSKSARLKRVRYSDTGTGRRVVGQPSSSRSGRSGRVAEWSSIRHDVNGKRVCGGCHFHLRVAGATFFGSHHSNHEHLPSLSNTFPSLSRLLLTVRIDKLSRSPVTHAEIVATDLLPEWVSSSCTRSSTTIALMPSRPARSRTNSAAKSPLTLPCRSTPSSSPCVPKVSS